MRLSASCYSNTLFFCYLDQRRCKKCVCQLSNLELGNSAILFNNSVRKIVEVLFKMRNTLIKLFFKYDFFIDYFNKSAKLFWSTLQDAKNDLRI